MSNSHLDVPRISTAPAGRPPHHVRQTKTPPHHRVSSLATPLIPGTNRTAATSSPEQVAAPVVCPPIHPPQPRPATTSEVFTSVIAEASEEVSAKTAQPLEQPTEAPTFIYPAQRELPTSETGSSKVRFHDSETDLDFTYLLLRSRTLVLPKEPRPLEETADGTVGESPQEEPEPNSKQYQKVELGRGSYGCVSIAIDPKTRARYAVKTICHPSNRSENDPDLGKRRSIYTEVKFSKRAGILLDHTQHPSEKYTRVTGKPMTKTRLVLN